MKTNEYLKQINFNFKKWKNAFQSNRITRKKLNYAKKWALDRIKYRRDKFQKKRAQIASKFDLIKATNEKLK